MKYSLSTIIAFLFITMSHAQTIIPLYDVVPNSKPTKIQEQIVGDSGKPRITKVTFPTLTMYTPANNAITHGAVIICPGGGYVRLAIDPEGHDVARKLAEWGLTTFVLKYRLPDDSIEVNKTIAPLQDAQRAIQIVRLNARQWNIDPNKVGIMGFSAGGHLASTASTHFDRIVIQNTDINLRPDFSILIYPVISFADSLMHKGSRDYLLGTDLSKDRINYYSNEQQVNAKTSPTFLIHASDDKTVPVNNSLQYALSLSKYRVPFEMHIYPQGGHGFGMFNKTTQDQWIERLYNWMKANSWCN